MRKSQQPNNFFPPNQNYQNKGFINNKDKQNIKGYNLKYGIFVYIYYKIKVILANLYENCKDQNSSRVIQSHFESVSDDEKEKLFLEIKDDLPTLAKDVFGNYVIQKMLEKGFNQNIYINNFY